MKFFYPFVCIALTLSLTQARPDVLGIGGWVGGAVKDATKWTSQAAKDATQWTDTAAKDATQWTSTAAKDATQWTGTAVKDATQWTGQAAKDATQWTSTAAKDATQWTDRAVKDAERWTNQAAEDVGDFVRPDHLVEHIASAARSRPLRFVTGLLNPECYRRTIAECTPAEGTQPRKEIEALIASGREFEFLDDLWELAKISTSCFVSI
ncbi:hypothetical protein QAD02_009496 [Eretmocerus hayati]|uniref:Uncharacterized protein n=1 Tax=Eretmocerus hayati TaxID=131215 RepID=A0ACC2NAR4_9HYME|nr:hypothetical protein QAD02_009496 [Eretmocerus hayati]